MAQVDKDALSVMKQTGQEFAEKQVSRWSNDEWRMGPEMRERQMAHWQAVKDRIGEIVRLIKQEMKEAGK